MDGKRSYILKVIMQDILAAVIFFLFAGRINHVRGWLYFIIYLISTVLGLVYLNSKNPELLVERDKTRNNTKKWDKALLNSYLFLAFFIIYIVGGLDVRFTGSSISMVLIYPGIIIILLSSFLLIWSMKENEYFESTARIQHDREQKVCDTGPYTLIRHPGYLSIILWSVGVPLVIGSFYMYFPSMGIILIMVVRTFLEDEMLMEELPGYSEYSKIVKYRLIPYIW